jgi:hypothetical protein
MHSRDAEPDEATSLPYACAQAADVLLSLSIPLYQPIDGRPWLCGTAFIVRTPSGYFLVSAAHVLDRAEQNGLLFYSDPKTQRFVRGPCMRSSDTSRRREDLFDIGVVRLSDGAMPPYAGVNKDSVDASWLKPRDLPRKGKNHLIIGFPQSKTAISKASREVTVTSCAYRSDSINDDDYPRFGLDPRTHVAIRLDLKVGFDPDGKHRNLPRPQGMSGAPLIVLFDEDGVGEPRHFPIVAVGIEFRRTQSLLVGTDISIAMALIDSLS